ncbi:unnamed protein product [Caenorhabditis sp. 36 PRJEB53466]|nr:unnamed protein product [Caenorhabditis sp. 36 PRJEB53466]
MFSSVWILSALCAVVLAAEKAAPANPEVKDAPAGAHYGGNYGGPSSYAAPQYPVFQFPNFDVNYCSVHASFPLVGLDRRHGDRRRDRRSTYGVANDQPAAGAYGSASDPSYDAPVYAPPTFLPRPRPFDRQGCRNTAIYSHKSCQNCCQVASRANGNTSPVVGLLLTFDPKLSADKKHHNKDDQLNSPDRALQCVCCTSRRV